MTVKRTTAKTLRSSAPKVACPSPDLNIITVMKTTKINKQITQINTNVSSDQFDDLNELIKEEYLSDIIVTEEDNIVVVYCLTAEVKDVKDAIETALEQLEDCED